VQEFVEETYRQAGLDPAKSVVVDEKLFRPAEVNELRGDPSRARERLGWTARVHFHELVKIMLESDVRRLEAQVGVAPRGAPSGASAGAP
jgi:GDPmannose 4,6-dehydratase